MINPYSLMHNDEVKNELLIGLYNVKRLYSVPTLVCLDAHQSHSNQRSSKHLKWLLCKKYFAGFLLYIIDKLTLVVHNEN